jgi:hypothetical protein
MSIDSDPNLTPIPSPETGEGRSGGADLSAQGDINVGGDVVGRDKITHIHYESTQPAVSGQQQFSAERRAVYERLWGMLEEVHVKVRTDSLVRQEFDELITEVNAFCLKNSLHLEKAHSALAVEYLQHVFRLRQLVTQSRDKRIQQSWSITADLPPDTLEEYEELKAAWREVDRARETLIVEFRRVLQGD